MTIVRNVTELGIHNARTDDVLGHGTPAALAARTRHAHALATWRKAPLADREGWNAFFGNPPTEA